MPKVLPVQECASPMVAMGTSPPPLGASMGDTYAYNQGCRLASRGWGKMVLSHPSEVRETQTDPVSQETTQLSRLLVCKCSIPSTCVLLPVSLPLSFVTFLSLAS